MKVEYVHRDRGWRYPWRQMREIGDYFDVPPGKAKAVRSVASNRLVMTGYQFHCHTLADGTTRVMLLDIEPGALAP